MLLKLLSASVHLHIAHNDCTSCYIAHNSSEGIKNGYNIIAKYDTWELFFKTPNTVTILSNQFPKTEATEDL